MGDFMKKVFYLCTLLMMTTVVSCSHSNNQANNGKNRTPAASTESCLNTVINQYRCAFDSYSERVEMTYASDCKIIDDRVIFIDSNNRTLRSVHSSCQTSNYTFQSGSIIDNVVFDNRLFLVLSSNRIAFVGLDNNVYELLTSETTKANRKSYKRIDSVRVDGNVMTLGQDGGGDIRLTVDQVNKRIAEKKYDPITFN